MKAHDFIRLTNHIENDLQGAGYFIKVSLRDGRHYCCTFSPSLGNHSSLSLITLLDYADNDPPAIYVDVEDIVTISGPYMEPPNVS